ncbi:hypothetical protein [Shinella zoogloeoides]|uniref:hypothetical protein n=1 Tax=Shinella zoogloeoides TaxID=352475 RepID=UPI00299DC0B4|nr:hypothetical protein [Shinella zoogloeoides]
MNLDQHWGPCLPQATASVPEQLFQPRSLLKLSRDYGEIRSYLALAEKGFALPQMVHQAATILWVLDRDAQIWLAVEEQVTDGGRGTILLRGIDPAFGYTKLGHPSLLEPGPEKIARLGGEITWDGRLTGRPNWVISNRSGRFGLLDHQLIGMRAVVKEFEKYNIHLTGWHVDAKGKVQLL